MIRKLFKSFAILTVLSAIILTTASRSHAGPFDTAESRDFTYAFTISGYEPGTWFSEPSSLAVDERSGTIYVADIKAGYVDVFNIQGMPRQQYGSRNDIKAPFGLAVDSQGNIYISESDAGPVKVISSKGEKSTLELPADEGKPAPKPGRMTVDRDNNLYIIDRANNRIYIFDKDRKLKQKIGGTGSKRGEFKTLQDIAVDRQGRIYALDSSAGSPVQVFDKKGKYIYRFGFHGIGEQDISSAAALFVDRNDQIWVVDRGQHALKVFDRSGSFLRKFGSYGISESMFSQPIDAEMDNLGRIYILEAGGPRLQSFTLARPFEPFAPSGL